MAAPDDNSAPTEPDSGDADAGRAADPAPTVGMIDRAFARPLARGETMTISTDRVGNVIEIVIAGEKGCFMKDHFPALIGIGFVLIAVVLAFAFPAPTPLQVHILLAVLSLGGGAFASEIPGLIRVDLTLGQKFVIGATGAMAIFVILYFAVPAGAG